MFEPRGVLETIKTNPLPSGSSGTPSESMPRPGCYTFGRQVLRLEGRFVFSQGCGWVGRGVSRTGGAFLCTPSPVNPLGWQHHSEIEWATFGQA